MKARVKATGEIVDVIAIGDYINENGQIIGEYKDAHQMPYNSYDLDFYIEEGITIPDYWTRLEHQAAIAAMQGMLASLYDIPKFGSGDHYKDAAILASKYAHALVEKYKKEEMK